MNREARMLSLLLLFLAPAGHFLGAYLEGFGLLPPGAGFLVSAASLLLLPWLIAVWIAGRGKRSRAVRVGLFLGAVAVQAVLFLAVVPPGATSQTMGFAHRLSRTFPPEQLRACAGELRRKRADGTLRVRAGERFQGAFRDASAVEVDEAELPAALRGRFRAVYLQPGRDTEVWEVHYAFDFRTGIRCDDRRRVREFFQCSMADGVHAYRYERQ